MPKKNKTISKKEQKALLKKTNDIHKVYHKFMKEFGNKLSNPEDNYELMEQVEKFAKKYPNDIHVCPIDDSYYSCSDLVLIEHKSKNAWHGVTALVLSQCSGARPVEFFMYPDHVTKLIETLTVIKKKTNSLGGDTLELLKRNAKKNAQKKNS